MAWRVARSLNVLLAQLNTLAPNRSKAADGSIGDEAHQAQGSASDHNPWYGPGIVTARDFTHDPAGGLDCHKLASALASARDPRLKYMIWQGKIMDSRAQFRPWTWQPSSGHFHHLHLSVVASPAADDERPWSLPGLLNPNTEEDELDAKQSAALFRIKEILESDLQSMHWRIHAMAHGFGTIQGGPNGPREGHPEGDRVQTVDKIYELLNTVRRAVDMLPAGRPLPADDMGPQTPAGQQFALVQAVREINDALESLLGAKGSDS